MKQRLNWIIALSLLGITLVFLTACAPPASAAPIVPAHIETPNGFGPTYPWFVPQGCTFHLVSPTAVASNNTGNSAGWRGAVQGSPGVVRRMVIMQ